MSRQGSKELEISLREHRPVSLIYLNREGVLTQRVVQVTGLTEDSVQAYCLTRRQPRTFSREGILAASLQMPRGGMSSGRGARMAR